MATRIEITKPKQTKMLLKEYVIVTLQALKYFWGSPEKGKLNS